MTKKEILDLMLADMDNERKRELYMKQGLKKSKESLMRIYNAWLKDTENTKFYQLIIKG